MADSSKLTLPEHYELHLGKVAGGWKGEGATEGVSVFCFEGQPDPGVRTFATLGLSHHHLEHNGGVVRQELLISINDIYDDRIGPDILWMVAKRVLELHSAVPYGQVIRNTHAWLDGSKITAFYATWPSTFPEAFDDFDPEPPPIILRYLIPITSSEAAIAREKGWEWFEDRLFEQDMDFWDLMRDDMAGMSDGAAVPETRSE